jgi:hypothetical protein
VKLTNKFELPETFINVIQRPQYDKGDSQISATEILNSPRIVQLKRKHWDELEQDAADMVWSLFGSAVHEILQHGKSEHHIVEQRIFTEFHGWKISGAIDLQEVYEDGIIVSDYKVTGAWAVMNEKDDWHKQLNLYAWLVERVKGVTVKGLQIIAIVRDWSRRDAMMKDGYPKAPIVTIDIPLWSFEKRQQYVQDRLNLHNDAFFSSHAGDDMPLCTPEEMWEKPEYFAVKKEGGVRAKSVHEKREDAEKAMFMASASSKKKELFYIEHRPGARTRCEGFCQVAAFCSQHQAYLATKDKA